MSHNLRQGIPQTALLVLGLALTNGTLAAEPDLSGQLAQRLTQANPGCGAMPCLHFPHAVAEFYRQRRFRPAWLRQARPSREAIRLRELIHGADRDGLDPALYHLDAIDARLGVLFGTASPAPEPEIRIEIELLLTDAFLTLADHLADGRIDPRQVDPKHAVPPDDAPPVETLHTALITGDLAEALAAVRPADRGYSLLREALHRYRRLAKLGGWEPVPPGPALQHGDSGSRVARLRGRLAATGDLAAAAGSTTFDGTVEAAVQGFQRRHGLEADGVVGERTRLALNIPPAGRARQIAANLERWRWLPRSLGERHIRVNIADYRLEVFEQGEAVLDMRVIVGQPYRRTPVFSDAVRYLVLNPSWYVPPTIVREDVLPRVKADPTYLAQQDMTVLERRNGALARVDPATVDWSAVGSETNPYVFRQEPGPRNALGRIKFMFPNVYDVYLHDTPDVGLFARRARSLSSGCIRLADPLALATYLMRDDPAWDRTGLAVAIQTGRMQRLPLPKPVPIHIVYWTAWVDEAGTVQFRPDPYSRDATLMATLAKRGEG